MSLIILWKHTEKCRITRISCVLAAGASSSKVLQGEFLIMVLIKGQIERSRSMFLVIGNFTSYFEQMKLAPVGVS